MILSKTVYEVQADSIITKQKDIGYSCLCYMRAWDLADMLTGQVMECFTAPEVYGQQQDLTVQRSSLLQGTKSDAPGIEVVNLCPTLSLVVSSKRHDMYRSESQGPSNEMAGPHTQDSPQVAQFAVSSFPLPHCAAIQHGQTLHSGHYLHVAAYA